MPLPYPFSKKVSSLPAKVSISGCASRSSHAFGAHAHTRLAEVRKPGPPATGMHPAYSCTQTDADTHIGAALRIAAAHIQHHAFTVIMVKAVCTSENNRAAAIGAAHTARMKSLSFFFFSTLFPHFIERKSRKACKKTYRAKALAFGCLIQHLALSVFKQPSGLHIPSHAGLLSVPVCLMALS
jgi:hypothetical protein